MKAKLLNKPQIKNIWNKFMPSLNWIGKEAVVKHHKDVPFRLLETVPELSCGDANSGNLIVQGDNLHALKANALAIQRLCSEFGRLSTGYMAPLD